MPEESNERLERFKEAMEKPEDKNKSEELEEIMEKHEETLEVPTKPEKKSGYGLYMIIGMVCLIVGIFIVVTSVGGEFNTTNVMTFLVGFILAAASLFFFGFAYLKKKWGKVSLQKFRFTEKIIPLDKKLYLLGTAVPTKKEYPDSSHNAVVKRSREHDTLVISDKKEKELSKNTRFTWRFLLGGLGIIGSVAGFLFFLFYVPIEDESIKVFLFLGFVLFSSVVTFYKGFTELGRQQRVESTPTSKVRSMSMGLVELKGKARPIKGKVRAPFTGKECVGYSCEVEREVRTKRSSYWQTLDEFELYPDFYLEDETGSVAVDPTDSNIIIDDQFREVVKDLYKLPDPALAFVADGRVTGIDFDEDSRVGY